MRVGLFLPNCPYYVICFFAVLKAGGTVVNYNPLYAEREIARQIEDSRTSIMVTLNIKAMYPKVARRLVDTCLEKIVVGSMGGLLPWRERTLFAVLRRKRSPTSRPTTATKLIANDGRYAPVEIDPARDVAVLQYTGGTTGLPKGAMLTHAALDTHAAGRHVGDRQPARPGEGGRRAALFHVFGMTGVMNVALAAASRSSCCRASPGSAAQGDRQGARHGAAGRADHVLGDQRLHAARAVRSVQPAPVHLRRRAAAARCRRRSSS